MSPMRKRIRPGEVAGVMAIAPESREPEIQVYRYGSCQLSETAVTGDLAAADLHPDSGEVVWIDVQGLGDEARLRELAAVLRIPDLALADVVNVPQRAKVELLPEHVFVVAHHTWRDAEGALRSGQVSLFLGEGYVLSLHDDPQDCWAAVRRRLRNGRSQVTRRGADYLLYVLLDTLIDLYFPVLEDTAERIEAIQEDVFGQPDASTQERIFALRRELLLLRRGIWPLRELASLLLRDDGGVIDKHTASHLRDCLDHASLLSDMVDSQRDLVEGLGDAHAAAMANRMNEVMKVLTIIATVFIPLSFVAGVFGMNFERDGRPWNMPELDLPFGYLLFWGFCTLVAVVMMVLFRRKRWL